MENKNDIRKKYKQARMDLTEEEREEKSAGVAKRIAAMPEYRKASTVLVYHSLPGETRLEPLISHPVSRGKRFAYPTCMNATEMTARLPGSWREGRFGILEPDPAASEEIPPEEIDLVVCPGIAFDEKRTRLGAGAGYYDRYLPKCKNAYIIMAAFEAQHAPHLSREEWDVQMDRIVTEKDEY